MGWDWVGTGVVAWMGGWVGGRVYGRSTRTPWDLSARSTMVDVGSMQDRSGFDSGSIGDRFVVYSGSIGRNDVDSGSIWRRLGASILRATWGSGKILVRLGVNLGSILGRSRVDSGSTRGRSCVDPWSTWCRSGVDRGRPGVDPGSSRGPQRTCARPSRYAAPSAWLQVFRGLHGDLIEEHIIKDRPSIVVTSRVVVHDPRAPPVMRIEPNVPPACERLQL